MFKWNFCISLGPTMNPQGPCLVTSVQLVYVSLTTVLWELWFSHFSVPHTSLLSSLYFISLLRKVLWRTVLKVLLKKNILCSALVHWAGYFVIKVYWVGQTWLPLHKSMLPGSHHHLVLHAFGNSFLDYLLHHLPKDLGNIEYIYTPQIPNPSTWTSDTYFTHSIRTFHSGTEHLYQNQLLPRCLSF